MKTMKLLPVKTILIIGLLVFGASGSSAASWPEVHSPSFISALNYGFAHSLLSDYDLNCWSQSLCGDDAVKLTGAIHNKVGATIKVNIFGRKTDEGSVGIFVFFPDFQTGNRELVLKFSQENGRYLFLGDGLEEELLQSDFKEKDVDFVVPKNCHAVINAEFQPKTTDVTRLQQWCRDVLSNAYPDSANKTNHFFVEPFSLRYDDFHASFYWVEGKKIIRAELVVNPNNQRVDPKELFDFSQMLDGNLENVSNAEGSNERMNYEIAKHVTGLLLTVEPVQTHTGRYTVIKGDTVASIARKFQISITDFKAMNPGLNPTRLEVGQMITVSNPTKQ